MQYSVRERRDLHHEPNGFRESAAPPPPPPRRHEGPPAHGNGSSSAQGSPSTSYLASRRSSLGQARTDSASGRAQEREGYERRDREYPAYEYVRRQPREGMDGGEGYGHGQGRRPSVAEMSEERERERERGHEHRALQKQRRASQDGADERRQMRREREWEREHAGEKEREDIVPRVREGEPMD